MASKELPKKWRKEIDVKNKYGTFMCEGCGEISMTPPDMTFTDMTSAWVRFKQAHRSCTL